MSDESDFTINVKVNGLEDVERLRKALEGVSVANAMRDASTHASEAWAKALTDALSGATPEPERCTFTVGDKLYSILARNARVVQEAIEAACADLNGKTQGPRFSIGDVVHLVSGGPPLAIVAFGESVQAENGEWSMPSRDSVTCAWFVDDVAHRAQFPADCLEP